MSHTIEHHVVGRPNHEITQSTARKVIFRAAGRMNDDIDDVRQHSVSFLLKINKAD